MFYPGARRALRGFTLFEMTLAVAIVALVAALALGHDSGGVARKVDLAAAEIRSAFAFARAETLRTGQMHGVHARTTPDGVRVFRLDPGTDPPTRVYDVYHPVSRHLWDVDFDDLPLSSGVGVARSYTYRGACNDVHYVAFREDATPSCTDPLAVLLEQAEVTVALGHESRTVTLHGFTGRVTVQ